jgi:hypothetical protein
MSRVPAELLREYVNSQKFGSAADVMEIKETCSIMLFTGLWKQIAKKLSYEKSKRLPNGNGDEMAESKNHRNGFQENSVKTQTGKI